LDLGHEQIIHGLKASVSDRDAGLHPYELHNVPVNVTTLLSPHPPSCCFDRLARNFIDARVTYVAELKLQTREKIRLDAMVRVYNTVKAE